MKGYYINPKEKIIQEIILYQNIETSVSNLRDTIKLILDVDFVEIMWYNEHYFLYYQKQDSLYKQKELFWFEIKTEKETKTIFGSALLVPILLEQEEEFNIKFLYEYEPPIQDFIL